ncbi:DNA double-strand break repair protein mre11 (mre11) [Thermococcus sp. 4557]|uniref:metallophosphoesterase family protein n=1 Tax=Thermococcus sp. (strain CGMCC 1.5172 / 4557) TaxID=1042877 RepID=UPI000219E812|nr:exonuclease SbcCD subunit D [Thermococcus sp. 4557]AEK71957.1 DNA double-strand break repair protein mre11 (mre11) [Thermococcus sp. 4557]
MRFAHIADVHLGREQFNQPFRYDDYLKVFRESIEKAVKARVDFILIAGDLFHVSRPSPRTIRDAVEVLELPRRKGIPVFAIEGNHDKTIRETSVFDLLEHLGLIYTVGLKREPREGEFQRSRKISENRYLVWGQVGDLEIHGLRHHTRWQLIRQEGAVNVLKALFKGKKGILMLHQAVDYLAKDTPYQDAFDLKLNELPDGFSYYALGHIHVRRVAEPEQTGLSGPLVYPGSLERTEVREASHTIRYSLRDKKPKVTESREGPKGFYIVEDFQPEFVEVDARPFYSIRVEGDSKSQLRKRVEEAASLVPKDAIAVITLEGTIKGGVSLAEFNDLLKDSGIMYYTFRSRVVGETVLSKERLSEEELFTEWERELLLNLRVSPKEFSEGLTEFVSWLIGRYEKGIPEKARKVPETEKREEPEKKEKVSESTAKPEKPKPEKDLGKEPPKKPRPISKPKNPSSLDAWLRRGKP